ncbi:MAG: CpXC domain-containing protein, partial [Chloroflexota bacterium]
MPLIKTQINCPNCRQMIAAEIEQLFDVGQDPASKSRLLSGQFNLANCPHCDYHGNLATPLVYHDHEKELLLTFMPSDLNMPQNEREKALGSIITPMVNAMPQEERKGYLLNPQATFTLQGLVERILAEDGVTKEMIDAQQTRVNLIQRLAGIEDEEALEVEVKEEDANIDGEFFTLMNRLIESTMAQGDQNSAQALTALQQKLLPLTTFGKELQEQSKEVEAAVAELQEIGEKLSRENLLELVINAPNEIRMNAYVSLARPGFDYEFFGLLTEKVEASEGDEKERLEKLRETLLETTKQMDEQLEARLKISAENLKILLAAEDLRAATLQNLPAIDEYFIQVLNAEVNAAKEAKNKEYEDKLMIIVGTINEASQAQEGGGPDMQLIQELVEADD